MKSESESPCSSRGIGLHCTISRGAPRDRNRKSRYLSRRFIDQFACAQVTC